MTAYHNNRCFSILNADKGCRKADKKSLTFYLKNVLLHDFKHLLFELGGQLQKKVGRCCSNLITAKLLLLQPHGAEQLAKQPI